MACDFPLYIRGRGLMGIKAPAAAWNSACVETRARPTRPERVIIGHSWIRSGVTLTTAYTATAGVGPGGGGTRGSNVRIFA